ncbi:MAG: lipid asymmetry maintenance protein MlaB [Methylophilaceae bacterium]|nr:STAS domain-containing protein [Methylophilaceae bacterium]
MSLIETQGNTLRISGAMTLENVNALLEESNAAFTAENLEMDLAGVSEVDSTAVSLMFEWLRQAHKRNISLTFVNLPSNLVNMATLYGVLDLIPQHHH